MHNELIEKRDAIAALCRQYHVRRLDVFGSATTDAFDPERSDIDMIVEFEDPMPIRRFTAYFELKEQLEQLLNRSIDLVEPGGVRNKYYRLGIEATREPFYAA